MRAEALDAIVESTGFALMAQEVGLPKKGMYTVREVAEASGVSYRTLCEEASANRLRTFVPLGRERGRLVKPEWFDEWFSAGVSEEGIA